MIIFKRRPSIIHCCTQKTASQWFIKFINELINEGSVKLSNKSFKQFRKNVIFKKSKYTEPSYSLQNELYNFSKDDFGFSELKDNTFYSSFYVGPGILSQLKNRNTKVFFVLRDPRDLVVSWYYSAKYSHAPSKDINRVRDKLTSINFEDGIKYSIDQMEEFGIFDAVRNWMNVDKNLKNFHIFFFDKFVTNYYEFTKDLVKYLGLNITEMRLDKIIKNNSFENHSNGRKIGNQNLKSHYRSGAVNQWKNELNEELINYFNSRTNDLGSDYDKFRSHNN